MKSSTFGTIFGLVALSVAMTACAHKQQQTTNAELLAAHDGNAYEEEIVTADGYESHEDQGASISPRTLAHIDDTIRSVYNTDFERCLEKEMDRLETKWLAGAFTVEFHIDTKGNVHDVNVLNMEVGERRVPKGQTPRKADQFGPCLKERLVEWQFDPAPEAAFVHTYTGELEEAW
ncbi:MAG: hypothetical protein V3V08_01975 [Nannocystaceae bacterium]